MHTPEHLPGALDADEADVEGVVQNCGELVLRHLPSPLRLESEAPHFLRESDKAPVAPCIEVERSPDKGGCDGIERFCFALSLVEIPRRRSKGVDALLESPIEPLLRLLPQIPDVVGGITA